MIFAIYIVYVFSFRIEDVIYEKHNYKEDLQGFYSHENWKSREFWKCVVQGWECFGEQRNIPKFFVKVIEMFNNDFNLDRSSENLRRGSIYLSYFISWEFIVVS